MTRREFAAPLAPLEQAAEQAAAEDRMLREMLHIEKEKAATRPEPHLSYLTGGPPLDVPPPPLTAPPSGPPQAVPPPPLTAPLTGPPMTAEMVEKIRAVLDAQAKLQTLEEHRKATAKLLEKLTADCVVAAEDLSTAISMMGNGLGFSSGSASSGGTDQCHSHGLPAAP